MEPTLKKNKASYWDYRKVKKALAGDLKPYRFLGKDLRQYRKALTKTNSPMLVLAKVPH